MKFIVDAQLPKRLAVFLREQGYDAVHTLELPNQNRTKDIEINTLSIQQKRIVISKDEDFYNSFTAKQEPYKLIYLTVGNLSNQALLEVFKRNMNHLFAILDKSSVIEMNQHFVITLF